jgi:hypothetical protein
MTPENERAHTPEAAGESTFTAHPFTEDAPEVDEVDDGTVPDAAAPDAAPGVAEFGPLFGGRYADGFQQHWGAIQSGFVEDPAGAVRLAKDLTDEIIGSLTVALEERRTALDVSSRDGDTEQLRLVLRQYREVLESVTSL